MKFREYLLQVMYTLCTGSVIIFASGSTAKTIEDGRNTVSYLNSTRKNTFKKFITIIIMKWFELKIQLLVFEITKVNLMKRVMNSFKPYINLIVYLEKTINR
jgi:hypothetical protein